jgi:HD-GYP domain-containing protein (c-di-GMP phosphodiesterase class II)
MDGGGYPAGLKEKNIPFQVRITTVCDAFDAMTSDRPYRKGRDLPNALEELEKEAGSQFDPDLVKVFIDLVNEGGVQDIMADRVPSDEPLEESVSSGEPESGKSQLYEVKKEETPVENPADNLSYLSSQGPKLVS